MNRSMIASLKNIEIPRGVEYIGKECFALSGVRNVTLPATPSRYWDLKVVQVGGTVRSASRST